MKLSRKGNEAMELTTVKLVTIIAKRTLKPDLIRFFKAVGVTGYTFCEVQGKGAELHGRSSTEAKNIQFTVLASQMISVSLMKAIAEEYIPGKNLIIFQQDATVLRSDKFGPGGAVS
jgi:nitrogen regulatory protein PII